MYQITDAGRTELKEHAAQTQAFWSRFRDRTPSGAGFHEINFLRDAVNDLTRTVGDGIRTAVFSGDVDTVHAFRLAIERLQSEVREIITQGPSTQSQDAPSGETQNFRVVGQ